MARQKRMVPRYKSLLIGIGLLMAERQARKKVGRRLAWPLGRIGRGLLGRKVGHYSPCNFPTLRA